MKAGAKMKFDGATVRSDFPGDGQAGLKGLRLPVEADQNAAGEIANGFGGIFLYEQRIESFWFTAQTEMEFAAGLDSRFGAGESRPAQNKNKSENDPNA